MMNREMSLKKDGYLERLIQIKEAEENLLKFYEKVDKKPKFMCIICGLWGNVVKNPKTGIYIIPITALKP